MSEPFDPYYTWLAIPPEEQPPNHYRLLGLRLFESKPEVIENAADQRMAHLRAIQTGRHVKQAQQILNEVSAARIALLTPARKQAYDANLRAELEAQAAQVDEESGAELSTTLGEFLQHIKDEKRRPSASGIGKRGPQTPDAGLDLPPSPVPSSRPAAVFVQAPTREERRMKLAIYAGTAAVAVLLLAIGVAWYLRSGANGAAEDTAETALVFDWPKDDRQGITLYVDGKAVAWPKSGPLVHACKSGDRRVRAVRDGFKPFETSVKVREGERKSLSPAWQPLSQLVIEWPAAERPGGRLTIDNRVFGLAAARDDPQAVRVTVDPGEHRVRIERRGYQPFEQTVQVLEGDSRALRPALKKTGDSGAPEVGPAPGDVAQEKPKPGEPAGDEKPAAQEEPRKLLAPPAEAAQAQIAKSLDDLYQTAAADTAAAKAAVARKMFDAGEKYRQSPDERYVLLSRAAQLAAEGGDVELMFKTAETVAADYSVEAVDLKAKGVKDFAAGASAPAQFKTLMETADAVINLAQAEGKYQLAADLADRVYEACSRSPGRPYRKQAFDRRGEVQRVIQEHDLFLAALKTLETRPDDPEANATAGHWHCVKRGDWEKGLPCLAKGSDEAVKLVAGRDAGTSPAKAEEQVALGDLWWDLAQSGKGEERNAWLLRAGHWYKLAESSAASAVLKDKIAQRLPAIDKIKPPPGARPLGQRRPGEALRPDEWTDLLRWIEVERDGAEGDWKRAKDALRCTATGAQRARLTVPVAVEGSYDFQVDFTAAKGPACPAVVHLPVGDRACLLVLFGWNGKISGLETIDGQPADRNLTITSDNFIEATRYSAMVSVRVDGDRAKISTTLNGSPHVAWEGNRSSLAVAEPWRLAQPKALGLGNSGADTTFHAIRFKLVSGTASYAPAARTAGLVPAPPPAESKPAPPEENPIPVAATPGPLGRLALVLEPGTVPGAVAWSLETIGLRGEVRAMAFHPTRDILATAGEDAVIRLWDAEAGKFLKALLGHSARIHDLSWSPDGARLASASGDGTVRIWEIESGRAVHVLQDRKEWARKAAWSPDGKTLVTTGREEGLHFYDAASGRLTASLDKGDVGEHYDVAFSPDGKMLASAGNGRKVSLWDAVSRGKLRDLEMGEGGGWASVCWAGDGKSLLGLHAGVLYHWTAENGDLRRKFGSEVGGFAVMPDDRTVLAATAGTNKLKAVQLWDLTTGRLSSQQDRPAHETGVSALALARDGKTYALACDRGVRIVRAGRGSAASVVLPSHTGSVLAAAFSPNNNFLACANRAGSARIWEAATGALARELLPAHGPDSAVRQVAFSPDGSLLAGDVSHGDVGNNDSRLFLWDSRSGSVAAKANIGWRTSPCLAWHSSGKALAYGGGKTQIFNPATGKLIIEFEPQSNALAWTPNGKYLAARPQDGDEVRICDPATGMAFQTIKTPRADQRWGAAAFSPDGKRIACGVRETHGACVCDLERGTIAVEMRHQHESPVSSIQWLDGGKTLVTGSQTETCVWEADTGKLVRRIAGGGDVFSPDGKLVVERGCSMVRFRSLEDGRVIQTVLSLAGQESAVLSPDGHYRGSRGAKKELVCVVQTEAGQETLTPDEFARKHNWKNAPSQVKH